MHDELVPGLLQIGRHAFAHHAKADESDAHVPSADRKTATGRVCCATLPSARITPLPRHARGACRSFPAILMKAVTRWQEWLKQIRRKT